MNNISYSKLLRKVKCILTDTNEIIMPRIDLGEYFEISCEVDWIYHCDKDGWEIRRINTKYLKQIEWIQLTEEEKQRIEKEESEENNEEPEEQESPEERIEL